MAELSKSPDRYSFQKNSLSKQIDKNVFDELIEIIENISNQKEQNLNSALHNLEYDLRSTDWILKKARASKIYAQNLYAAMCNRQFQKRDTWPILKDERWSCSWRHAGGIVADMLQEGDYIDWYCSGMGGLSQDYNDTETYEEWQARTKFVPEGKITDEIAQDLNNLGWIIFDIKDDNR
jgi:hypothetical protein